MSEIWHKVRCQNQFPEELKPERCNKCLRQFQTVFILITFLSAESTQITKVHEEVFETLYFYLIFTKYVNKFIHFHDSWANEPFSNACFQRWNSQPAENLFF